MQTILPLDFTLSFCREMLPGQGEDSYCLSFCENAGLLAVFDGCGGAGARTHNYFSGHTEAYMASRLCAGAFYDAFRAAFPCRLSARAVAERVFAPEALARLKQYTPPVEPGGFVMKGSMVRTLPTTAAAALIQPGSGDALAVSAIWAGDSRVYVLDGDGLAQLTVDDTSVPDPMENVYEDGVLRNILCSDREVTLHCTTVEVKLPFVVLTATDGCFGYVSTPMEFEGLLLQTLLGAETPARWETTLADTIGALAGDDHSLCLAAFGYGSFENLQDSLRQRLAWLTQQFLIPVSRLPVEDRESRFALWAQYRDNYSRWMEGGWS